MKTLMIKIMPSLLFGLMISSIPAQIVQAALLEGKVMDVDLHHRSTEADPGVIIDSGDFVVEPGVELMDFGMRDNPPLPALVDIDISDTNILITLLIDQPFAFQEFLLFQDANDTIDAIKSVMINPATNWSGIISNPNRISNLGNGIGVDVSQLSGLQGQIISLDLMGIPEPAGAALVATALTAVVAFRRRQK